MLICGILIFRVFQKISSKAVSNDMPSSPSGRAMYLSIATGMSAVLAFVLLAAEGELASISSLPTLGLVIAFSTGVTLCISSLCSLLAMQGSSVILGSLFGMAGLLVPMISGIYIYEQRVSLLQWGGILLLFVSAWLLASSSQKTNGKITAKTLLLLCLSMIANGGTMLLQTLYKNFVPTGSVSLYSFLQFFIPSVVLFPVSFILSKKGEKEKTFFQKKMYIFTVISAVSLLGISQLSTMASAIIPVAVIFPISDGGGMIIAAIVASSLYKEKLNPKSIFGIIIGIAGILAMKLFGT